jgi:hypothetical protein
MDRLWALLGPILLVAWVVLVIVRIAMRRRIDEERKEQFGTAIAVVFALGFIISFLTVVTDP